MIPIPDFPPRNVDMSPEAIDQRLRECSRLSAIEFAKDAVERARLTAEFLERKRVVVAGVTAADPSATDTPRQETAL
jgi:UDP-N-acetylglucosamine 2-epimerase